MNVYRRAGSDGPMLYKTNGGLHSGMSVVVLEVCVMTFDHNDHLAFRLEGKPAYYLLVKEINEKLGACAADFQRIRKEYFTAFSRHESVDHLKELLAHCYDRILFLLQAYMGPDRRDVSKPPLTFDPDTGKILFAL